MASIASRLRPRNLNQALGWLLASVVIPLLLGTTVLLVVQWRQEKQLAENHLTALAQSLIRAIDSELDHGRAQLEVIAASPIIDARDWEQLHRFGSEVASTRSGSLIVLVGPDGQALLNTSVPWGQQLPNLWKLGEQKREVPWQGRSLPLSSQALTRQIFERGQVAYSDLYYGMHAQQPRLALAVPVIRQGKVVYALELSMPPALLERLIRSAVNAPGLRSLLVDRRGVVVATNATAAVRLGDVAMPIDVPPGSTAGHYELTARDGTPVRGAYAVSANNGFVVRASLERAFLPARDTWASWVALMLGVLGAGIVLASWVGRRLARPLRDLGQQVREGRPPSKEPASGIAEFEVLAQALRAGAEAEQQRRNEHVLRVVAEQQEALVKHSEARLKRVLDQLFVFVGMLDLAGRVVEGNAVPIKRAGIRSRDVIGKPFWDCHWWTHNDTVSQQVRSAVERAAQGETLRFDIHGRFESGGLLTVDLQLAPLRDEAGTITHVIASGVDVEARVQAMRQLERSEARAVESARQLDAEQRMLEATLEAAPVGIAVTDPQGRLLRINQAGADLLGIAGAADRNQATRALRGWPHAPGTQEAVPLPPDQWPLQLALAQRHSVTNIIDIAPADNAVRRRTVLMSAAPVVDAAGSLIAGVVVQMDITQRVQAEASLRRADRQKDEFLATLAHELRNPLAPIRTAVELIRLRDPADTIVQRARVIIERQVTHLSRLVDDLLDVSRITMGTIQLRQETPDLGAIAVTAAESVATALETAGLTLEQQIEKRPVLVHGDGTRLAQCILNLLNNAVKFTPRGGHIVLRVVQEGPMAVVEVSDNGTGVAPDSLERIFELFVQERPSGVDGNTGLGIGLALTRKLVELHGGTVRAESAGLGHGTTVRIALPAAAAESAGPLSLANARPVSGEGTRVLVVDDNRDAADTLGEMLSMSGFGVTVAYDGESALGAVERDVPDAVLLDVGLPDLDGYEVCRRIRRSAVATQPVLIALTGWGQDKDREVATAAGFNAHLTKPAEPDRIIALLNDLVPRSSQEPIKPQESIASASPG